ncbi:hypothetical protein H4Q26_018130 [Puccinia striiformis f. sp. tritici PST-130]|nr:hypothetical protein H4Q26_018130 [Puccinia striiformis f. sp. tritici PST-130]
MQGQPQTEGKDRLGSPPPYIPPIHHGINHSDDTSLAGSSSDGWMARYRTRRSICRPELKEVKEYTDRWMAAYESGQVPPLPQDEEDPEEWFGIEEGPAIGNNDQDQDDGGGWTVVSRGGQHGRSATTTISTQPQSKARGADPYAQSSMADRDASAAVKVMKRNFAKTLSAHEIDEEDQSSNKKRRGGQLNPNFYRASNPKNLKKHRFILPLKRSDSGDHPFRLKAPL